MASAHRAAAAHRLVAPRASPTPFRRAGPGRAAQPGHARFQGHDLQHAQPVRGLRPDPPAVGGQRPLLVRFEHRRALPFPRSRHRRAHGRVACATWNSSGCPNPRRACRSTASSWSSGCVAKPPPDATKRRFRGSRYRCFGASQLPPAPLECAPSKPRFQALLAQLVEHFIRNEGVICSNQIEGTTSGEGPLSGFIYEVNEYSRTPDQLRILRGSACSRACLSSSGTLRAFRGLVRLAVFPYRRHVVDGNLKSRFPSGTTPRANG